MIKHTDTYTPVDCGLHSEYELAIMHKTKVNLSWKDSDNIQHAETAIPIDTIIRDKQEFLKIRTIENIIHEIRLDRIIQFKADNIN